MTIPSHMTELARWVVHRAKIPHDPKNGKPASSTDPSTWSTYDQARAALAAGGGYDGLGFVFAEGGGIMGVDLDHCLDAGGQLLPWAKQFIEGWCAPTFAEISPSGTGLHLFYRSDRQLPKGRKIKSPTGDGPIELYDSGRYFTVTGRVWSDEDLTLLDDLDWAALEDGLGEFAGKSVGLFEAAPAPGSTPTLAPPVEIGRDLPQAKLEALLEFDLAFAATWNLGRGFTKDDGSPDGSSYDLALASIAAGAGWTDAEIASLLLAFRTRHGLDPRKATRQDYISATVARAKSTSPPLSGGKAEAGQDNDHQHHDRQGGGGGKRGPSQAQLLLKLAEGLELFHTSDGNAYSRPVVGGHVETHSIKSRAFREWWASQLYFATGKPPSGQALADASNVLEAKARFESPEMEVFIRVGSQDGKVYLDLGRPEWSVVEVDAQGWRVLPASPVMFRRPAGLLPLPEPEAPGDLSLLRGLVNLGPEENFTLAVAWLVGSLHPHGPFLALNLQGEQGSGKSLTSRMLRQVFDPVKGGARTAPREEKDLMVAAAGGWVVSFDNLSGVPTWLSDALCRIATGGALASRTLYTNDEETILEAKRPLLLNGITAIASRHDLVDRSIILSLPPLLEDGRRPEDEIWQTFQEAHPRILAGLLDAVSAALRNKGKMKLDALPRMADAALWISQAEEALPWRPGDFMRAYQANRAQAIEASLEADPVAGAVLAFMAGVESWKGSAKELLDSLGAWAGEHQHRSLAWPGAPHVLSSRLTRAATFLRKQGIETEVGIKGAHGKREVRLTSVMESTPGAGTRAGGAGMGLEDEPIPF